MKKVIIGIIMVMVMVLMTSAIAFANSPEIFNFIYPEWQKANKDILKMFRETVYYSDGFVKDGIAYYCDDWCYIAGSEKYFTVPELEKYIEDIFKKEYWISADCEIEIIGVNGGRYIYSVSIITDTDLRYAGKTNVTYTEPVYGMYVICYDRSMYN